MNIYVGNLAYSVGEQDLERVFSEFGEVVSVKIITDRDTGHSKGFAFVEMGDEDSGSAAIDGLHDQELSGRNLKVSKARPRTNNFGNDRRGGGGGGFRNNNRW
ncbi:MAG: RNA-binding protein [Bacteroidota bacterium]